jgi:hypothetical protein
MQFRQMFRKSSQNINKKAQNISIKQLLKPLNTYGKPCDETAWLGEN